MAKVKILTVAGLLSFLALIVSVSCTKNPVTPPPVHDTVTVVKHDTTTKNDTLYATKPDTTINLTKGLVLYLPFNGSFADSSGNGNTVTAYGGAALDYDMHGYANAAFSATGAGERLIVSNNGAFQVDTAFSVSCDFMMNASAYYSGGGNYSGLQTFLNLANTSNAMGATFAVGMINPGYPQYLTIGVQGAQPNICTSYQPNDPMNVNDTTQFTPVLGAWYNLVCIYHKTTVSVYINGQLISTQTNPSSTAAAYCSASTFTVGAWWGTTASSLESLHGKLDEVRFYNRVLTPHEVTWLARNFQVNSTRYSPGLRTAH